MRHSIDETKKAINAMIMHMRVVQRLRSDPEFRHNPAVDHHMSVIRDIARQIGGEYDAVIDSSTGNV